uniref:Uncharacterized protein n=1 Tax=viral metagenome TaxID=1070528 RepID=A0A6M3IF83_9ZZZZ
MNEYERTKKWLAEYLRHQFVSDEAPDDECVRESEFILSNPLILIKADEQSLPECPDNIIFYNGDYAYKMAQKDMVGFVKVVKKEAQDER